MSAELVVMTLADARLPAGGHTQSAGLEPAVRAGLDVDEVIGFARDRLRTVVMVDAATAVVARAATLADGSAMVVEPHWAARTASPAVRAAARRQGRGYLRLAARVWPRVLDHLPANAEIARPVVLGAVAAVTGLSSEQTARLTAYEDVQTVVAASLKLLPIDPAEAAGWGAALHPEIEGLVAEVSDLVDPEAIPGSGAPLLELYAERHITEQRRLFHA